MIKINLLPADMRKVERTPMPKLMSIYIGVGLNVALLAALLLFFKWIGDVEDEIDTARTDLAKAQADADKYDKDKAELDKIVTLKKTVEELRTLGVHVSKRMDEIIDIIPPNIWLTKMILKPEQPPKQAKDNPTPYTLLMTCRSLESPSHNISTLRRRLQAHQSGLDPALMGQMQSFSKESNQAGLPVTPGYELTSISKEQAGFQWLQGVHFNLRGNYKKSGSAAPAAAPTAPAAPAK